LQKLVIEYLAVVEAKLIYAELGFSSLFEFCTKDLGYSDASAYRRIESMRLLKTIPLARKEEISSKIESGEISLTNLSLVQNFIKTEKKVTGKTYTPEEKLELIEATQNKSKREVERALAQVQPLILPREKERVVSQSQTEIHFLADQKLMEKFARVKELRAHANPSLTYAEMFELMTEFYLKHQDPTEKANRAEERKTTRDQPTKEQRAQKVESSGPGSVTSPAKSKTAITARSRFIPSAIKHAVWKRDLGSCTYMDPKSTRRCGTRFGLELDHIHPYSMWGEHSVENLRLRCKHHNQLHWKQIEEGKVPVQRPH